MRSTGTKQKRKIDVARRAQIGAEKRARTRALILDSAFDLLGRERGLDTRIEEICETSGISRGTFYNYFTSMHELFSELSYEISHDFNRSVTALVSKLPDADQRTGFAIRYFLEHAQKDRKWAWAMINLSAGGQILGSDTAELVQRAADEGIASGNFDLTSSTSGCDLALGAMFAAMVTQLRQPIGPHYPAAIARHVLRGMGVSKERADRIARVSLPDPLFPDDRPNSVQSIKSA